MTQTITTPYGMLNNTLAFGPAPGLAIHFSGDVVILVLRYPLKFVTLHHTWRPLFELLDGSPATVPLDRLGAAMPSVEPARIAAFLDSLMYKGFLVRSGNEGLTRFPSVSVIIPVRNRPKEITLCLTALAELDYPADKIEIIVVDDASTDATAEQVPQFSVRLIRLKRHKQASFCRNVGAKQASGEILAFIDSDCLAHPRWLLELLPAFNDTSLSALGGRIDAYRPCRKLDFYEKVKSSLMVTPYAKQSEKADPFFYLPACNFLIRRSVFRHLKGFRVDLTVGEDVDLCWRLQDRGRRLAFCPEGIVYHQHRNRLWAFCKRRFQYGTSEPLLQRLHPGRKKNFLAPPSAIAIWAALVLTVISGFLPFLAVSVLVWLLDGLKAHRRFKRWPIGFGRLLIARLRGYGAFGYHLCAFISRYYLWVVLVFLPFLPVIALVIALMHLLNAAVEFRLKKPQIHFGWFLGYFTLEQLSYHAGVWRACLSNRTLRPVLPKIIYHSPAD